MPNDPLPDFPQTLLADLEERFSVLHAVPNGVCLIDEAFCIVFWNLCLESWTGIQRSQALGKKIFQVVPKLEAPRYRIRIQSLFSGGPPVIFSSQLHPNLFPSNEGIVPRQFYTKVSALDFQGRYLALFSLEDVSELNQRILDYRESNQKANKEIEQRKVAEKILRKTLDERDILIREVHHRVKNNLQLISGLIFIHKAELEEDSALIPVMDDLWHRIQSVSIIHDKLYRSNDLGELDVKEYLESLVETLLKNLTDLSGKIDVTYDMPNIDLDVDKIIQLGLITAELITNAIKYSFNPNGGGKLRVAIRKISGQDKLRFSIANFPNTLKDGYNPGKSQGLGMSVINMVMEQLQTKLEVHNGKWAEFAFLLDYVE